MPINITILGLDALGASLGLAFGTLEPKVLEGGRPHVTGWDKRRKTLDMARGRLAVDVAAPDLASAVRAADVVFVNVPTSELDATFEAIAPHLQQGAIVTDTASVKAPVVALAKQLLPPSVQFIGGHPFTTIAGDDLNAAGIDGLRDAIYCLVPAVDSSLAAVNGMTALVTAIGAKAYFMDAAEHDSYAAGGAHLPLITAFALMATVGRNVGWPDIQAIAGEALAGTTALAEGEPAMVAAVLHGNRAALRHWLDEFQGTLDELRDTLDDPSALTSILAQANAARAAWMESSPNARPGEADTYSNVQDVEPNNIAGLFFGRRVFRRKG